MADSSSRGDNQERNDVWADVRGHTVHGTYSVTGDWVEVTADDGRYKSAAIGESSVEEVAERLLAELYKRDSGAVTD
jgi:hypothetical protein